jgi:SAM-dependent methyltransferase
MDQLASASEAGALNTDPHGLDEMRAQIAAGTKLTGGFAQRFLRAVHSEDPLATEEALASLPGNRGVHLYDSLVAWSPIRAGERILDLGCGSGGATRSAARAVGAEGHVLGIDINQACIEAARERTPGDLRATYRCADARSLPFVEDRSIDCVVASMLLDEVEDLRPVLAEVFRVLRPGGRFVASVAAFDIWRPMDLAFMGTVLAIVGTYAPGALAGRAVRAGIPHDRPDRAAFADSGLATLEMQDVQLAAVLEDEDDAWRLFSRSLIGKVLGDEGREALLTKLRRRTPHTLYLPIRFIRTRRPG